jgi:hypothetical protein
MVCRAVADRPSGRISTAVLLATPLTTGFSLAVSVAEGLLERSRPFALLRLSGTGPGDLRRVLITEVEVPLITARTISAGIGFAVGTAPAFAFLDPSGAR